MVTETQYSELKSRQAIYEKWSENFKQKNGWIVIPKEATPPVTFENEDRSKIEIYEFVTQKPARYFAYYHSGSRLIRNWMGEQLALVEYYSVPKVSSFGDKRVYFSARGINGIRYHGVAYVPAGDYCRMRAYKNQKGGSK
jgi:hypothetical protein